MKETLASKFNHVVSPYLNEVGIIPGISQKRVKSDIHTAAVCASIAAYRVNPVLGTIPPPIHPSEESLPRAYRTTLAQLRSGKCANLKTYQHFINAVDDDLCPDCCSAPHTTNHLFSCDSHLTTLTVIDL
jgi:hypothetical protein